MNRGFAFTLLISCCVFTCEVTAQSDSSALQPLDYSIERTVMRSGFDGKTCWVHARAGIIPTAEAQPLESPQVVLTTQKLLLSGSDVFYRLHQSSTQDAGRTWAPLTPIDSFARQKILNSAGKETVTGASIAPHLLQVGDQTTVCDFSPQWHVASQRLLGIGQSVWYRDNRVLHTRPRGIAYAVYDAQRNRWSSWKTASLPKREEFQSAGAGSAQRLDLLGGDTLVPFYFKKPTENQYSVAVGRFRFDGYSLEYIEHGNTLTIPIKRGLYEPSITCFGEKYFLTLRNDDHAYVCKSNDGLHFSAPEKWKFDDGTDLGSYNTQQHWITHSGGLYLAYTRKGANNDHVFRHRAPLFLAQVDPQSLRILRNTERILVPERGARLGNFGVTDVSPNETWITVAEWMQPKGVEAHGSDNSIHVVKLIWNQPNGLHNKTRPKGVRSDINSYFRPPVSLQHEFGDFHSPLQFDDGSQVTTPEQWRQRREQLHSRWTKDLGKWPPLITNPKVEFLESSTRENFVQHKIRFLWTPNQFTSGYLLIPKGKTSMPAVVTVYYEPETSIGYGTSHRDFALQLARRGFATLSIGTTEATAKKEYSLYYPSIDNADVQPLSMLGYAAANAWYVLAQQPQVDSTRIGIVGHSFGGKWAMFASCLFDKFACAAWSDPGIVFDDHRPSINYWEPWYLGYHRKPWRERGLVSKNNPAQGLYPELRARRRDLHELHALMAPRPFLVSGGSEDPITRWSALNHSIRVNQILGEVGRVAMTNRPDHSPNPDSNEVIYQFFERFLATPDSP